MSGNITTIIPKVAEGAFPVLLNAEHVKRIIPSFAPDTIFDIFALSSGGLLAFVTSDYPDPRDESRDLKKISRCYEFVDLVRPFANDKTIEIQEHDDMDGDFFVTRPYKNYKLYYYLANIKATRLPG